MKKMLLTGTFDPPTMGHLDIIRRGANLCDKLVVGIAININKRSQPFLTIEQRTDLLKKMTQDIPNVEVISFEGLVVDFAKKNGIDGLLRGLRPSADPDYEFQMASANRKMIGIETLFLLSDEKYSHISSTLIREIASYGHSVEAFVPQEVAKVLSRR